MVMGNFLGSTYNYVVKYLFMSESVATRNQLREFELTI